MAVALQPLGFGNPPQDTPRTIVSDDFTKNRPPARGQSKTPRKSKAPEGESSAGRSYRLASQPSTKPPSKTRFSPSSQLGLTMWKLRRGVAGVSRARIPGSEKGADPWGWIAESVEADTVFHADDQLRLSIESPRAGYLYVIDRDWFTDGNFGATKLIFPVRGDDNRLQAGTLIDIPAESQPPFTATPEPNQEGEILTIIVTSSPLRLPISDKPLPISNMQLMEWEEVWGGTTERFEMVGGTGRVRTRQEQQAAARNGTRQLTRNDPAPQTIYLVTPKNGGAFLFNVKLSYAR